MITEQDKKKLEEWLVNNLQLTSKSNVELIVKHVDHYFQSPPPIPSQEGDENYQSRVNDWMQVCFGKEISKDIMERNHRFIEECLELIQTTGATKSECHQLVDYVFDRSVGETHQEIGGVMVTLAALCNAINQNMKDAGETELKRIWTKVDKIRDKQAAKPKHSPLPVNPTPVPEAILFDTWKHENGWVQYLGFDTPTFSKEKPIAGKQVYFSSAELYQLFLQRKTS